MSGRMGLENRGGTTLVEVLVAIFVMAIGLLTLLTLFPLGALNMAQAIQDDRTAHAAKNAEAIAEARNFRNGYFFTNLPPIQQPDVDPFCNPGILPNLWNVPNYSGPSYPVYLDPVGVSFTRVMVPESFTKGIPRRTILSPSTLPPPSPLARPLVQSGEIFRLFSVLDDMDFQRDGTQAGAPTNPVEREGRYTWAYMLRRPRYYDSAVVDVAVVVYSGRSLQLPIGEYPASAIRFDPATNIVNLPYDPTNKPPMRKGMWILDATVLNGNLPEPHGYFYRVVGVTDNSSANTYTLELQNNPKARTFDPATGRNYGVLVVMEKVVEVFEKGSGWQP